MTQVAEFKALLKGTEETHYWNSRVEEETSDIDGNEISIGLVKEWSMTDDSGQATMIWDSSIQTWDYIKAWTGIAIKKTVLTEDWGDPNVIS